MQLTDYAVYKDNNEFWTLTEIRIIAIAMGDFSLIVETPNSIRKFVYQRPVDKKVYPWLAQNIENKTQISYSDFIKLISQQNSYLTERELIKWESINSYKKFTVNCDMVRIGNTVPGILLGQTYKLLAIHRHREDSSNVCFTIKDSLDNIRRWTSSTMWKLKPYEKSYEKSTKQEKPMANRTGKYLSLKIKDGKANTRSLIFQAYATRINDPRPFIKELINNEMKSLKQTLNDINLYSIEYGYNVKLASLVSFGILLQQKLYADINYELSLWECVNTYLLLDELEQFNEAKEVQIHWSDPYTWIANYLTHSVLSIPKPKVLFNSNKFKIHIKDGYIYLFEKKLNMESRAEIKLDVKSNTYYI